MSVLKQKLITLADKTPVDAALLSIGFEHIQESSDKLTNTIKGEDWSWILHQPLFEVGLRLLALYRINPQLIDGSATAQLAKRLVATEVAVGGPYYDLDGRPSIVGNAMVAQLFTAFNSPLPNIQVFLEEQLKESPHAFQDQRTHWTMNWPYQLVTLPLPTSSKQKDLLGLVARLTSIAAKPLAVAKTSSASNDTNAVVQQVHTDLQSLPLAVKHNALRLWQGVARADKRGEISQLSIYFAESLKRPKVIDPLLPQQLGVANFYAWMAYTIYDDFIDDEGQPAMLPVANMMHRASLWRYHSLADNSELREMIINRAYDTVDTANAWEIAHCRFEVDAHAITIGTIPHYGNGDFLARRAIGHGLGPTIIALQTKLSRVARESIQKGLVHYLIARQLNDDAHDWVEDLERGHISFVVAHLLRQTNIRPGTYPLSELTEQLQEYFWQSGLEEICAITLDHATRARRYFKRSQILLPDSSFIHNVIDPIEAIAQQTLAIHTDQKNFLKVYSQPISTL